MKKLIVAILLLNICSVACLAISINSSTDEKIEYIKKKSIKMQTKRMQTVWKSLCKTDPKTCEEKQEWFDELLYNTNVRKYDMNFMWYQLHRN